jgi:hypothetical protein
VSGCPLVQDFRRKVRHALAVGWLDTSGYQGSFRYPRRHAVRNQIETIYTGRSAPGDNHRRLEYEQVPGVTWKRLNCSAGRLPSLGIRD